MKQMWTRTIGCLFFSLAAFGQTFGELTGTVTDPSGASVSGATVTVRNTATNQLRTVESNEAGNWTVPFLVPGVYDLEANMQGFKTATRKGLILQVGDTSRVDFRL
jgi:hypothetical protein